MLRRLYLAVSGLLLGTALLSSALLAGDRIMLPPLREEFFSPAQTYLLVVSTADRWQSQRSLARFYHFKGGTSHLLWQRLLPHHYRPRFIVVSDGGAVVLLDEWLNIKTPYAVMILDRQGRVVTRYDFDAVARLLGVSGAELVAHARYGAWLAAMPRLDPAADTVRVAAGGRHLAVQLRTGRITVTQ